MKYTILYMACLFSNILYSQNTLKAVVTDSDSKEKLIGVSAFIDTLKLGSISDLNGQIIMSNIPDGNYLIEFSYIGYSTISKSINFPLIDSTEIIEIELEQEASELDEITVSTTRSTLSIQDAPTRIEALSAEELEEKGTMKPGDIRMLLNEATGVSTQQTSAISGTANIRIQGLDGRYTMILRDGMPLYSGFNSGISIMQITPLDLKQVEFIKGSASTLYGGGAIAGLVNLISKTPTDKRQINILLNGTSARGMDASLFYAQRNKKIGTTIFTAYNFNAPYDPAKSGLTAIPKINRFSINPKLFIYAIKKSELWLGFNTTYEDRFGGDIQVIKGRSDTAHTYFERNKTFRFSTQLNYTFIINEKSRITIKNTVGYFKRDQKRSNLNFNGNQITSYTEVSYSKENEKTQWVTGANVWTDNFKTVDTPNLNYKLITLGVFAQNLYKPVKWFSLETGLRIDYNTPITADRLKGAFILPRVNLLFKINNHWSSRIGGGLGYKMPTYFNEETEENGYNINPVSFRSLKAEKSYGVNADINYKTVIDETTITINQLFFYTYLNNPVILQNNELINATGYIDTKGGETNIKVDWKNLKILLGYTFVDARQHYMNQNIWQPLTAKHRLNLILMYEKEDNYRIGLEGYYTGKQQLSDLTTRKGYFTFGFLFEKIWEHVNIFVNAENFTDRRQTRRESVYSGSITNPVFNEIYMPLDGAVVSAGLKLKF